MKGSIDGITRHIHRAHHIYRDFTGAYHRCKCGAKKRVPSIEPRMAFIEIKSIKEIPNEQRTA